MSPTAYDSDASTAVSASEAADAPATCAHCGLPVYRRSSDSGPHFCCTGCQLVYGALQQAGMSDTFYRLRNLDEYTQQPARTSIPEHVLSEFDTAAFLDEHTQHNTDGSRTVTLFLDGVHCAACVWLVERLPVVVPGVLEARLDLPRARVHLTWHPDDVGLSEVARHLARFGYQAHPLREGTHTQRTDAERRLLIKVGACWALAGNVMLLAFAFYAGVGLTNEPGLAQAARYLSLALALAALAIGGSVFFRRAWASVRMAIAARSLRALHMDTPIALGLAIGFSDSAWATLSGQGDVWFDSITVLIAALLTARWLQLRSRRLAGDAGERLLSLIPSMARRLADTETPADDAEWVPAHELRPGDFILVHAGDVFPVDGTVVSGASSVNNAVLTGESRAEPVSTGDSVAAGATNLTAPVRVEVSATGDATRVGEILRWVRDASARHAPVVLLADRLGGYFVAAALLLAAITALIWLALDPSQATAHVVALLVITCPCALGMATPLAMAVAAGRAARAGLFIKSDEATQQLTRIDTIVLDKTGTLTEGRLTLVDFTGDEDALDLAAALEATSTHPIADALVRARPGALLPVTEAETVTGHGVRGTVDGRAVCIGRADWLAEQGMPLPGPLDAALATYAQRGHTPVTVAVDGQAVAALAFGDGLRPDAAETMETLRDEGYNVYLLSGDHPSVVERVADALGLPLDQAYGNVSPEDKRAFIERLWGEGRTVAMVGDGVNDAAALQAAHVGVAVAGGSTAGLVAADVFITQPGLRPITSLLDGAHTTMQVIRRNLGVSLAYNLCGAAAAMAGLVTPLVAAVAMPISSLIVVVLSITQRSFGESPSPGVAPTPAVLPPRLVHQPAA